ncbi:MULTISPECIES: hypothetical protein [Rhodococcus]|uniref:hypothetical protein n=1 Tax=Rhodococcus TaxID=1827 RepID=UPI000ACB19B7|nr:MULTISPECIES: hypothetical protein [Rhodococcus]
MTGKRQLPRMGVTAMVPERVSYAIAGAMGFYVLALIMVFTFLVPRLSPGSATVVTTAAVTAFAVLLMIAMMCAARMPLHPAVSPAAGEASLDRKNIVEGWAVVLETDVHSKSVTLNVTVPGTGTYRREVRAERSVVSELVAGTTISVWVDIHHHQRTTLVGAAPTFDDAAARRRY